MKTGMLILFTTTAALSVANSALAGGSLETVDITSMSVTVPGTVDGLVIPYVWDERCLPVDFTLDATPPNVGTPDEVDINTTRVELQTSFDMWNDIRTSFIEMNIAQTADLRGGVLTPPGVIGAFDFINELNFLTDGGFLAAAPSVSLIQDTTLNPGDDIDLDGDSDVFAPSPALGKTCADVDGDGDIEFPAGHYRAGTILENDVGFSVTNGLPWNTVPDETLSVDIQAVAVHEFGHSHGLSHSLINQISEDDGAGATMFPFIDINDPGTEEAQRTPATDDIAWSSYLYPEGSANSGPAQLTGNDRAFAKEFGLISGEVLSGTLGGAVAGANVFAVDLFSGEVVTSGFSGTTQIIVAPGPTGTDADAGLFLGPDAAFSILNGKFRFPVPAGRYRIGLQSLDGLPAAPGNISITAIVGSVFGDLAFQEEFWDRDEAAFEVLPGQARPARVRNGRTTSGIVLTSNVDVTLRNTDGVFDADDPFGFIDAPGGRFYAVRFSNAGVQALLAPGNSLHTGLFLTDVSDASAPVKFASARLATGAINPDGTAYIAIDAPLRIQRDLLGQDTDFSTFFFKAPEGLTAGVKGLLSSFPDLDLFLVLELPNAPFPGFAGLPPTVGLDNDTVGSSFLSDDGGATFTPQADFNYFFELVTTP